MSYQQFRQRCQACKAEWNAAFGVVGQSVIAQPPVECPECGSTKLEKIVEDWELNCRQALTTSCTLVDKEAVHGQHQSNDRRLGPTNQ